ncbi:hypothetical protein [Kineosporia babensis]|uniref:Uncharacterized protein n=1 Tax=Kineosporia babensis TaxID=499548 RepID=A0A9X1SX48_9ACTN|nr:hypothetical protein [Kineosporia babensis]MCD5314770.1 hypothetical protein [Kineosporia babensis]
MQHYLIGTGPQGTVVLDGPSDEIRIVDPQGRRSWRGRMPEEGSYVAGVDGWSRAILSSRIELWDEPDPLPRETVGSEGVREWDVPRTWRMRVLAGPSLNDHLMLRGHQDGSGQVDLVRSSGANEVIELPTAQMEWSDSPGGEAGVLYRFGGESQEAEYFVFRRLDGEWRAVVQGLLPGPVITMDVSDQGDVTATALGHGLVVVMADGTRRHWPVEDHKLPTMAWLHGATVTLTRNMLSDGEDRTRVWRYDETGALAWEELLAGEWTVSLSPVTGAVMMSQENESVVFGLDGRRVHEPAIEGLRVFGQDGAWVTLRPDGTVDRQPAK